MVRRTKITAVDHGEIDGLKIQASAVLDRAHSRLIGNRPYLTLGHRQCSDAISSLETDSERPPAQISLTAVLPLD